MKNVITILLFVLSLLESEAQDISLTGNLWFENSEINEYDIDLHVEGAKIFLVNANTLEIVDSAWVNDGEFRFPGINNTSIDSGEYYLEISEEEFLTGGALHNIPSCEGFINAILAIDNDDNGMDDIPSRTTNFILSSGHVEHIDFCFKPMCFGTNTGILECGLITEEDIFCQVSLLNNVCGTMNSTKSGGLQPSPLCNGMGEADNIIWYGFVAAEGDYSISINHVNCFGSLLPEVEGIQVGVYTDCTFSEEVFCEEVFDMNPVSISSDHFVSGGLYYLYIDGYAGSICDFIITVQGTPEEVTFLPENVCAYQNGMLLCDEANFCPDSEITIKATGIEYSTEIHWDIITLSGDPYIGETSPVTEKPTFNLNISGEGVYEICLSQIDNSCQTWIGYECITIHTDSGPEDEYFGSVHICTDSLVKFDISILDTQDPNGDGIFGWQDVSSPINFGSNSIEIIDANGCVYEQSFELVEIFEPQFTFYTNADSLCVGDSLVLIVESSDSSYSIQFFEDGIELNDSIEVIIPNAGAHEYMAKLINICGEKTDNLSVFVYDTISTPMVHCDTSTIGSILLTWPEVAGAQGYSLVLNNEDSILTTDTFYFLNDLDDGEMVNLIFSLIDTTRCVIDELELTCQSALLNSLEELELTQMHIFPNPASISLIINRPKLAESSTYQIIDSRGRIVQNGTMKNEQSIDLKNISQGIYIIMIKDRDKNYHWIERFVKI